MTSSEPKPNNSINSPVCNLVYQSLKIDELEKNGLFLESYAGKLVYHGLTAGVLAGVLTRVIFRRFSIGFGFGLGYGAGQIHQDFNRAFQSGLKDPNLFARFSRLFQNCEIFSFTRNLFKFSTSQSQTNQSDVQSTQPLTNNSEIETKPTEVPVVDSQPTSKNL